MHISTDMSHIGPPTSEPIDENNLSHSPSNRKRSKKMRNRKNAVCSLSSDRSTIVSCDTLDSIPELPISPADSQISRVQFSQQPLPSIGGDAVMSEL